MNDERHVQQNSNLAFNYPTFWQFKRWRSKNSQLRKFYLQFQSQRIVFSNDFTESVTFCIRNDDLGESRGSPFNLVPIHEADVEYRTKSIKAQLKQGQKLILKAKFAPKAPGTYKVDVPIFVKGYSNGIVYNYITLKGELKRPQLTPSSNEVSLLGTTKRKNFQIFALTFFSCDFG